MPLYEIPLLERSTDVGERPGFSCKVKCLHIDKVGLFIYYDDEKQLDSNFIRRHLIFRKETRCLIEAYNVETAISIFYNEWEGAKIGGDSPEAKALWINKKKEILELPHCDLMHKNNEDQFICGELVESGNGEFGMCLLEGYDRPEGCAIGDFRDQLYEKRKANDLPVEILQGFKLIRAKQLLRR